jgi:hypothetical protein
VSTATPSESLAAMLSSLAFLSLKRWCSLTSRPLEVVGHDLPRKAAVARVTGYVLARAVRSFGVARENACVVLLAQEEL